LDSGFSSSGAVFPSSTGVFLIPRLRGSEGTRKARIFNGILRRTNRDQALLLPSDRSQCTNASEPPRCAIASFSRKRNFSANCFAVTGEFSAIGGFFTFSNEFLPPPSIFVRICPHNQPCIR